MYALIQMIGAPLPQGAPQRDEKADCLSVERLCTLAGVARAGYYRWLEEAAPSLEKAGVEETGVRDAIQRIALVHRRYGYRRIAAQLRRDGWCVNHKRVLRLMREDNLLCLRAKPFVPATTQSRHGWTVVPNRVRGLRPSAMDQLWVADITYIRLADEFIYLAVVLDAYSRKIIGWALEPHLQATLAVAALDMAIRARRPRPDSLIHHSDRGVQYACFDYTAVLDAHAIQASMSRPANPYDNAKAESFMKTLKQEEVDGRAYRDLAHARKEIGGFIEAVYNRTPPPFGAGLQTTRGVRSRTPPNTSLDPGDPARIISLQPVVPQFVCLTIGVHSSPPPPLRG